MRAVVDRPLPRYHAGVAYPLRENRRPATYLFQFAENRPAILVTVANFRASSEIGACDGRPVDFSICRCYRRCPKAEKGLHRSSVWRRRGFAHGFLLRPWKGLRQLRPNWPRLL
ncbi:hypothetical protein AB395_0000592 [Sinorhizobium fredii CCBAU 45436]|nr:hypothetical protein AB395_0000592 [Sinorhizobium fredii CCBAU 45436]